MAALDEMKTEARSGGLRGDGNLTVRKLLEHWRDEVLPSRSRPLAPATIVVYDWTIAVLLAELGGIRLSKLGYDDVENAFARLADRELGRSSLVKIRSVLGQALDFAQKRGYVVRNVARLSDIPHSASRRKHGRSLTLDQAQVLLAAAIDDRLNALWVTMLYLGLRPGEATGLCWDSVDLDGAVIHVRRSLKTGHGAMRLDDVLKTSTSRRSICASEPVIAGLRVHQARQREQRLAVGFAWVGERWSHPVFTSSIGSPIGGKELRAAFSVLTRRAGLGHWHPHELRHSTASLLSAAGVPIEHIADLLGHKSTVMTREVY